MPENFPPAVLVGILGGTSDTAIARSPYCPTLIPIFKAHGGRWQRGASAWLLDAEQEPALAAATAPFRLMTTSAALATGGPTRPLTLVVDDLHRDADGHLWQVHAETVRRAFDDEAQELRDVWSAVVTAATPEQVAAAEAREAG